MKNTGYVFEITKKPGFYARDYGDTEATTPKTKVLSRAQVACTRKFAREIKYPGEKLCRVELDKNGKAIRLL